MFSDVLCIRVLSVDLVSVSKNAINSACVDTLQAYPLTVWKCSTKQYNGYVNYKISSVMIASCGYRQYSQ